MRQQKKCVQDETPEDQPSELKADYLPGGGGGDQSNDSKDDQKYWEKKGTYWEDARNV